MPPRMEALDGGSGKLNERAALRRGQLIGMVGNPECAM